MSRKLSDGTVESAEDFTIPRQGRKRKPAFAKAPSGQDAGGKLPASPARSPQAAESGALGSTAQTGSSAEHVSASIRSKWILPAGAVAIGLVVVALLLTRMFGGENPVTFDALLSRSCSGFHGLPSAEKPPDDAAVALFAAACKNTPAGR